MDMQGNIVKKWDCMNDAFREKGYYVGFISLCCRGEYKSAYGYIWKYAESQEVNINMDIEKEIKEIQNRRKSLLFDCRL